jgi:hypothetical protein
MCDNWGLTQKCDGLGIHYREKNLNSNSVCGLLNDESHIQPSFFFFFSAVGDMGTPPLIVASSELRALLASLECKAAAAAATRALT